MRISVSAQSIGRRKTAVQPVKMELKSSPDTLRDLICLCVEACVERQHRRLDAPEETVLSAEQMDALSQTGKIAFGVDYNGTPAKLDQAVENALQSYQDGLYRVFLNGREIKGLDAALSLTENDTLAFIRLTMLAGAPW
jgi:hypothetical protein